MSLRLKIIRILNKNTDNLLRLHWPELSRYCGCCPLSIGIYIRCILSLVKIVMVAIFVGFYVVHVLNIKWMVNNSSIRLVRGQNNVTISGQELTNFLDLMTALVAYYMVYLVLKVVHLFSVIAGVCAIFCNKPRLLGAAIYGIFPNWIFDIIILIGAKVFLRPSIQMILLLDACSDGYNLLAMNSQYKKMALKSRIVPEELLQTSSDTTPSTSTIPSCTDSTAYCLSCYNPTPFDHRSEEAHPNVPTPSDDVAAAVPSEHEQKVVNFKDGPIIFDQEQLQGQNSLFLDNDGILSKNTLNLERT